MKTVIYGQDERVVKWVSDRIEAELISPTAVGIGLEKDGELVGGVIYDWYTGPSITAHVAGSPGRYWGNRDFLWRVFAYPFLQLQCNRITGFVRADNFEAQRLDEHLGFKREGVLRQANRDGTDMIVYGMLKDECRFLRMKK
jgi:RimJ/RimL family protein N-acetyltransferase